MRVSFTRPQRGGPVSSRQVRQQLSCAASTTSQSALQYSSEHKLTVYKVRSLAVLKVQVKPGFGWRKEESTGG